MGIVRMRSPVAVEIALHTAGKIGGSASSCSNSCLICLGGRESEERKQGDYRYEQLHFCPFATKSYFFFTS
jgi:hypothetical protein